MAGGRITQSHAQRKHYEISSDLNNNTNHSLSVLGRKTPGRTKAFLFVVVLIKAAQQAIYARRLYKPLCSTSWIVEKNNHFENLALGALAGQGIRENGEHEGTINWTFYGKLAGKGGKPYLVRLLLASAIPIKRHVKIKGEANP